jgi:hypothetical protein
MSEYEIRALDATTWDAFARLAEKHNGMGFGGCWCTWFHRERAGPTARWAAPGRSVSFARGERTPLWSSTARPRWRGVNTALRKSFRGSIHRKEWEAGLTGEPPAYRITCIFVTGTIGRKASQPWRFVEPSTGSRRRAERVKRIGYVGLRTDDVQAMTSFFRSG